MKRIVIFASGTGTNAENIIRYFGASVKASVVLVISNNAQAPVLEKARQLHVPAVCFPDEAFKNGEQILMTLRQYQADLIVLAGFLKLVPSLILNAFPRKIINIHPALLPRYGGKGMYGMKVHEAVFAANEAETGITVHYVNERFDEGEIIFQKTVTVNKSDTPSEISNKIHNLEMKYFPAVIENILEK